MGDLLRTALFNRHVSLGAKMVAFGGWEMPLHYPVGIVREHLATRKGAGLFDVSHMGRLVVRGLLLRAAQGLSKFAVRRNCGASEGVARVALHRSRSLRRMPISSANR